MATLVFYGQDVGRPTVPVVRSTGEGEGCLYSVAWPGELVREHRTKTGLLADLTGHPEGRHWSFDRYFRVGSWEPPENFLWPDLFKVLRTPPARSRSGVPDGLDPTKLALANGAGIDLVNRADEVAKLLFAGFGSWIRTSGYDPDDVLQEVYRGLLARNKGTCPWVKAKSSFGHYVHMVCHGVVANYHRKQQRKRKSEQVGITTWQKGEGLVIADVASASLPAPTPSETAGHELTVATHELGQYLGDGPGTDVARRVLPLLLDGFKPSEIAATLSLQRNAVDSAVRLIRGSARQWAQT